ncbi:MAG: divergent polysaccharide deacetylase family protein [Magnetococcus sp. DMHC-8]
MADGSPVPVGDAKPGGLRLTLAETLHRPGVPGRPPYRPGRPADRVEEPVVQPGRPATRPAAAVPSQAGPVQPTTATVPPGVPSDRSVAAPVPPVGGAPLFEEPPVAVGQEAPVGRRAAPIDKQAAPPPPTPLHTLAVIIDDLGHDWSIAKALVDLPADLTLAILPGLAHSREIARLGKAAGRELLLHQPMEPYRYPQISPGPGALLSHMDVPGWQATLRANLAQLPEVVGVNNHMGSRLTENAQAMDAVMAVLSTQQLFFIDSRTSEASVGAVRAAADQVPTAVRDVFIDNEPNEESIQRQLAQLERLAHKNGGAVGIGHPHRATLAALQHWLPTLSQKGIRLMRVSRFIRPATARARYPDRPPVARREPGRQTVAERPRPGADSAVGTIPSTPTSGN